MVLTENPVRRMMLMYRKYKCSDEESKIQAFVNYSQQRNTYFSAIKDAKANCQNIQFEKIRDTNTTSKEWWSLIKRTHKTNSYYELQPPLEIGENIITDDKDKAGQFNALFLKASDLDDRAARVPDYQRVCKGHTLSTIVITEEEVLDKLSILDVSKAYGPDKVPPKLLKEAKVQIYKILTTLFN